MKKLLLAIVCLSVVLGLVSFFPGLASKVRDGGYHEDIIVVNETRVEEDSEYRMDGIVFVDNGTLIFRNTNIAFYSDATNHYYINITNGSTLRLENVHLTTEKTIIDPYLNLTFTISNSTCIIKNSTLAHPGWLTVTNSNITIENSTITSRPEGGYGPLMFFENSSVILAKARIENYYETAHIVTLTTAGWPPEGKIVPAGSGVTVTPETDFYLEALQALPTPRLASSMLIVSYETEKNYTGTNYFQWSIGGVDFKNCSTPWESPDPARREYEIWPTYNSTKYDLWARGVRNISTLASIYIKFINNDPGGPGTNVTVKEVTIISACENDITFVNSTLYVFDSYIDVDFLSSDIDPVKGDDQRPTEFLYLGTAFPDELKDVYMEDCKAEHNVIRLLDNSTGYFYNITVDGVAQEDSDPCIIADDSSEAFVGRWTVITAMDSRYAPLENVGIEVTRAGVSIEPPNETVLSYLGKNDTNYNLTDENGVATFPLHSDLIGAPPSWPNSHISQNYRLTGKYLSYESSEDLSLPAFPNLTSEANTLKLDLMFDQLFIELYPALSISAPTIPTEDDTIWVNATIYNSGSLDASDVNVKFYRDSALLNATSVSPLAGSGVEVSNSWIAAPGYHTFTVVVDEENTIPERDELNNTDSETIRVYTKSNLVPELDFVSPIFVAENVMINVTIYNYGERNADNFTVQILIGAESINLTSWIEAGDYWVIPPIVRNFSSSGSYEIKVSVDTKGNVSESNEDDNEVSKTLIVTTLPELEIVNLNISPDYAGTIAINVTVNNTGGEDAENVVVRFYVEGVPVGDRLCTLIEAGGTQEFSLSYTLVAGEYKIKVKVDPENEIKEQDETEGTNVLEKTFKIKTLPDLYVDNIVFSKLNPIAHEIIEITARITNSGEVNASADILFYCNDAWRYTENIIILGKSSKNVTYKNFQVPEERTAEIKVKISNCVPAETNTANNELAKSLSIYLPEVFDWIIYEYEAEVSEINYTHTGHIVVLGSLTISNSTFSFLAASYEWHLAVLGNGRLIIENATLTSNYELKVYLYDNSILEARNSTLDVNILGEGNAELLLENAVLNGSFGLSCKSLTMKYTSVKGDFSVTAENLTVLNSNVTGINDVVTGEFYGENSTFESPLALPGTATLINVTGDITSKEKGIILRYWFAEIEVKDKAGSSLENATVRIYRAGILMVNKTTDKEGKLKAILPAWNITAYGDKFLGNYNLTAEYRTEELNWTADYSFSLTSNRLIQIAFPQIIIQPTALEVWVMLSTATVSPGDELSVGGTVKYNIGTKPGVGNANVTITIDGVSGSATTDENGNYLCSLTSPKKPGGYEVKVMVTDPKFNLLGEGEEQLTVSAPPEKPFDIMPIIIAIVIILIIVIALFILRKKLKPYFVVLKAKLKKEEFMECSECGKKIPSSLRKCLFCEAEFEEGKEEELAKCSECGAFIPITAKKCPKCGAVFKE